MRRLNGRFAKEPRRGVDPAEQRQIEEFIARKGVTKVEPNLGSEVVSSFTRLHGLYSPSNLFSNGRIAPRGHAP